MNLVNSGIMATATLGQVEPFEVEGGDWNVYSERLDQFVVANGVVDDAKKVAVFLMVIESRAYLCCETYWRRRSQPINRTVS